MTHIDPASLPWQHVVLGFALSTIGGALFLHVFIDKIAWRYVAKDLKGDGKVGRTLTNPLGILERASYTSALLLGAPTWIGVWLALKVAAQWSRWQGEDRAAYNVFLVGNLLSVMFGVGGAWIAIGQPPALHGP